MNYEIIDTFGGDAIVAKVTERHLAVKFAAQFEGFAVREVKPWPYFAFTREDMICIVEEDDDLLDVFSAHDLAVDEVITLFVDAQGKTADQACGAAVMEVLCAVFDHWLREIGYAD